MGQQATTVLATALDQSYVGRQVAIIDPAGGAVTGELRKVTHQPATTKLLINVATIKGASNSFMELTVLAEKQGPGKPYSIQTFLPSTQIVSVTS